MRILKNFKVWFGLKLLRRGRALLSSELIWYLCQHKIETLPAGSTIYAQNRFHTSISNSIINLLEMNCIIVNITKRTNIDNGDTVATISYIDSHTFSNIVNWASNNLKGEVGTDIAKWIETSDINKQV